MVRAQVRRPWQGLRFLIFNLSWGQESVVYPAPGAEIREAEEELTPCTELRR
jgi:hypothetical protein